MHTEPLATQPWVSFYVSILAFLSSCPFTFHTLLYTTYSRPKFHAVLLDASLNCRYSSILSKIRQQFTARSRIQTNKVGLGPCHLHHNHSAGVVVRSIPKRHHALDRCTGLEDQNQLLLADFWAFHVRQTQGYCQCLYCLHFCNSILCYMYSCGRYDSVRDDM